MDLPVIDFAECGLLKIDENEVKEESLLKAGSELYRAFAEVGFAYVINSGISNEIVEEMSGLSDLFFSLPTKEKLKFHNKKLYGICYDPEGVTEIIKDRGAEKVDCLRMHGWTDDAWPEIPEFRKKVLHFQDLCKTLILRIFRALGRGMKLKDADAFIKFHSLLNKEGNVSILQFSNYPAITEEIEEDRLRFAEHTDFGSLTLLFHGEGNGICGLQAELENEKYVDINQVPHGVLLTVGDQLQFCTGGRLRSSKHRVVVPKNEILRSTERKVTIYFALMDDEILLEELDFEDSKEKTYCPEKPMKAIEHLKKRFEKSFY